MVFACALTVSAAAQEIAGSGSTFCFPVMAKLAEAYEKISGTRILYQPIGSAEALPKSGTRLSISRSPSSAGGRAIAA